jgi:hypothetical protein
MPPVNKRNLQTKNTKMKTPVKTALTALSLAIVSVFAVSGCAGTHGPAAHSHETDIRGTGHVVGVRTPRAAAPAEHQGTDIRKP